MKLLDLRTPDLFKFCDPKHNIVSGCNTIRLGTLWGFRSEEDDFLRDRGEGEFEYKIKFPKPTQVSSAWLSEFSADVGERLSIKGFGANNGIYEIESASLRGSFSNSWIFCLSRSQSAAGNISRAYNDKWMIEGKNINKFSQYVAGLLFESIRISDLPETLLRDYSIKEIYEGISLDFQMRAVQYVDRFIEINSEEDLPVQRLREIKQNIPFMKPKIFSEEQEFRIVYSLFFKEARISITDSPKLLQLRKINEYISEVPL